MNPPLAWPRRTAGHRSSPPLGGTHLPNPATRYTEHVTWQRQFRYRVILGVGCFVFAYTVLAAKLVDATVLEPIKPNPLVLAANRPDLHMEIAPPDRAPIEASNGQLLAASLPGVALYADPAQIRHAQRAANRLKHVLPDLNEQTVLNRLRLRKATFAYLDRSLTSAQELAVNRLGIPGLYFQPEWIRHYLAGRIAAHILGGVTPGGRGVAGVEAYFNRRLIDHPREPLRLSIRLGVETVVHDALAKVVREYDARGACGIVESMSGRILAMVSLPDYNANDFHNAPRMALFDRCISGNYEPGSIMKLMTMSMALQSGMFHYWDRVNTTHPLTVDGFTIHDYEPVHRWLALPAVLAYSSCIGTSRIATALGPKIQRAWLHKMGFFKPSAIQMPGVQPGLWHARQDWRLLTTMSVSYGVGIAMPPIVLANAVVAAVNGGVLYKPTLLARTPGQPARRGTRIMTTSVSAVMRRLMRAVVLSGTGTYARVHGYLVAGKTGTAQVVDPKGGYYNSLNNASFISIFPAPDPKYLVYALVIHPKPTKRMQKFSFGFTTGGFVAAPAVGQIIKQIGPMLGVYPLSGQTLAQENKHFTLSLAPTPPPGQRALGPNNPFPRGAFRYAYVLAHKKPPHHSQFNRYAALTALRRVKMALPDQLPLPEGAWPPSRQAIALDRDGRQHGVEQNIKAARSGLS